MMKAILIDVTSQTVTDIELNEGLRVMYVAIGCQCVDRVALDRKNDLWLDDEGLLHDSQPAKFQLFSADNTFAGNGLICGYNAEGETISTTYTADKIRPFIQFLGTVHIQPEPPVIISWS